MGITTQDLEARIDEIAGGDATLRKTLLESIGQNEKAKETFVNGFLGRADVTRKQQEAAELKRQADQELNKYKSQIADYEQRLETADAEKDKIMRDLANQRISAATANERLQIIKDRWQLSDEDLPLPADVKETARRGRVVDSTDDVDERLNTRMKDFEKNILKQLEVKLIPSLGALAEIPRVMNNIESEHRELFGRGLSKAERDEFTKIAKEDPDGRGLQHAWESKFGVQAKRQELHDKTVVDKAIKEYEEKRAAEATERAMRGESENAMPGRVGSPLLNKKFELKAKPEDGKVVEPVRSSSATERDSRSGASRSRERYLKFQQTGGASEGVAIRGRQITPAA